MLHRFDPHSPSHMPSSNHAALGLRTLLNDIVDYAGLFPPARLELADAAARFARYRNGEFGWMLGRFVVPAARLAELSDHESFFSGPHPARLSVLLRAGDDLQSFIANARQDLGVIASFADAHDARVRIESLEAPLPTTWSSTDRLSAALKDLDEVVSFVLDPSVTTFLEMPWAASHADHLDTVASKLSPANRTRRAFGLKVRTGGLTPDLVPPVGDLARFIRTADRHGVPFKATAGLHHPACNDDANVGTTMFGFLNVFAGAVLLHTGAIDTDEFTDVLLEDDPTVFAFDDGMAWRDVHLGSDSIARARSFAVSFGSCSFDEPVEDLRALDLL